MNGFQKNNNEIYYSVGSFLFEIVKVFFWAVVIIVPIRVFLFQPFFVQGSSMDPNFKDGDYLIINEFGYKETDLGFDGLHFSIQSFKELQRGDVVVFRYPKNPKQYFIKRVIALPGEKIKIADGKVTVYNNDSPDGIILNENQYLSENLNTNGEIEKQLADDEYFVMGDNRLFSHDSRSWGPLGKDYIVGKVTVRAWPLVNSRIY